MPPDLFEPLTHAAPDAARVDSIRKTVTASLRPVRPLPPDAVLVLLSLAAFVALSVIGALPVGYAGYRALNVTRKVVIYPSLLMAAAFLCTAVAGQMIPAARRRVPTLLAVLFPLAALGVAVPVLFPNLGFADFARQGFPCLRFGLLCAVPSAIAVALFLRRGALTDPLPAMLCAGTLSGLVGVAALALHCPIFNAPHILVWHLGGILICALAGAAAGFALTWNRART